MELVSFIAEERQAEATLMGKSSTGPDLIDVETMMRAMGALHSGHVELVVKPRGLGLGTGVEIVASMNFDVLPGSALPSQVISQSEWPCGVCGSFWGHVFNGLYALDYQIGQVYEQSDLWEK